MSDKKSKSLMAKLAKIDAKADAINDEIDEYNKAFAKVKAAYEKKVEKLEAKLLPLFDQKDAVERELHAVAQT